MALTSETRIGPYEIVSPLGASLNPRALWMLRDGEVQPFGGEVTNALFAIAPVFAPDGRWVAYASTTTPQDGDVRTYVQPFPATGAKYLVGDGTQPLWSRDGDPSQVPSSVRPRVVGPKVERNHDILPDGRFLGVLAEAAAEGKQPAAAADLQLHVVMNRFEELRRLAPPK